MKEHHDIQSPPLCPEIVQELEEFQVEVLEIVLDILRHKAV